MNEKFRNNGLSWKITFTDDNIILQKGNSEKVYPYGSIKDIKLSFPSALTIIEHEKTDNGKNKSDFYTYTKEQKARLKELINYAKERMATASQAIKYDRQIIDNRHSRYFNTHRCDSIYFMYKEKKIHYRDGMGHRKTISAAEITSCEGMGFWEDLALHKIKITFKAGNETYIIEGDTIGANGYIPFSKYYDDIINDSKMPEPEKKAAKKNKSYGNVEMFANGVIKQSKEPITSKEKDASVIGRAIVGAAIAGEAGAIVGALSAVDKNNKNKK